MCFVWQEEIGKYRYYLIINIILLLLLGVTNNSVHNPANKAAQVGLLYSPCWPDSTSLPHIYNNRCLFVSQDLLYIVIVIPAAVVVVVIIQRVSSVSLFGRF